jgi:hypothetical protein
MKNKSVYSNDSRLFEQLRHQFGILPRIDSFPATSVTEQSGICRAAFTSGPASMHAETGNNPVLNPVGDGTLLKTVKGIVRSVVFFNWKDHA